MSRNSQAAKLVGPDLSMKFRLIGEGPTTVILHGGGPGSTSWTDFGPIVPDLLHSRQLLLVDLPHFGESGAPPFNTPVFDYYANCVEALLDELGIDTVDIVGQSLGGSVALCLAARRTRRIGKIVATSSQPMRHNLSNASLGPSVRVDYYGGEGPTLKKMRALIEKLEWYDANRIPDHTIRIRFENSVNRTALESMERTDQRGSRQDLSDRLPGVATPTLVIWGSHDPFAPPAYGQALADRLPHGDLYVMGRTSHHPQEERPHEFGKIVQAFLTN